MRRAAAITSSLALLATSVVLLAPTSPAAGANKSRCESRQNSTIEKITECVTLGGVKEHMAALQAIADANNGTRASGTPGGDASADYAIDVLEAAGYEVTTQSYDYKVFELLGTPELSRVSPNPAVFAFGDDFNVLDYSASGTSTAAVTPVDLQLGTPNFATSGCDATDFAGFPAGNIALLQRGFCEFRIKAQNAAAAGATAVVIMNQGNTFTADRQNVFTGTLSAAYTGGIPVVSISYAHGVELSSTPGLVMSVDVSSEINDVTVSNIFAETRTGNDNNVVMVGAHLDSSPNGPGINENASGVAAVLETAQQLARVAPRNTVRFALWATGIDTPLGVTTYLNTRTDDELAKLAMYLNFDTIASPNFGRFVLDGDGSVDGVQTSPSAKAIENFFANFYRGKGLSSEPSSVLVQGDQLPFVQFGVPVGGLTTGGSEIKSTDQQALFGGTAGEPFDPCYRQACDTLANINDSVLDVNADAVAASVLKYAMSTKGINGVPGKGNFEAPATDDEADVA